MDNILIVSGHTDLNDSVANRLIIDELKNAFPNAEFSILSELYSNFEIDVKAEQEKLVKADIVVLQFPVFWYSMPSLLRKWIEDVIVHGFAYGSTGMALKGKRLIASFTTGAPAEMYTKDGLVGYTIEDIIGAQLRPTANLCGMQLADFVYTDSVSYAARNEVGAIADIEKRSKEHARRLLEAIKS